jgi:hypothetical protein
VPEVIPFPLDLQHNRHVLSEAVGFNRFDFVKAALAFVTAAFFRRLTSPFVI